MKLRFQAIDQGGRVVRGVLRAESAEEAREFLTGENLFPKTLNECAGEERVTWAPKSRIKEALAAGGHRDSDSPPRIVAASFRTVAVMGFDAHTAGEAGLGEAGDFVFLPDSGAPLRIAPGELESALVAGFPARVLRLTLINGRMYEFRAGILLAKGGARSIVRAIRKAMN